MRLLLGAFVGIAVHASGSTRPGSHAAGVLVVQAGDAVTGAFIADAQVRLPSVRRVGRTKWDGEVHFDGIENGRYRIEVRAIGYAPGNVDVQVTGDTVPVHFQLERVSPTLDTVHVRAETLLRGLREFEDRSKNGLGRFFTDSALIEHRSLGLRMLLATRIPGLRVLGTGVISGNSCEVNFYFDGFALKEPRDLRYRRVIDLDGLPLRDFAGVEVYSEATVPAQYKPRNGACVTVLLWTKW